MRGGNHRYIVLFVVAVGVIVLAFSACATAGKRITRQTACGRASVSSGATAASLRVVGNQMVDSQGHPFVPYGISLVGGPENNFWSSTEKAAMPQIVASR